MTLEQMSFFGYKEVKLDKLDATDPAIQKQMLKGKRPFACSTCKEITWVRLGEKQVSFEGDGIHMHITTSYLSQKTNEVVQQENKLDIDYWGD